MDCRVAWQFSHSCWWGLDCGGQWYRSYMGLCLYFQEAGDIPVPSTIKMSYRKVAWRKWRHLSTSASYSSINHDVMKSSIR